MPQSVFNAAYSTGSHPPLHLPLPDAAAMPVSINDPPVVENQTYDIDEDQALVVTAANGLLKGAADVENDPLVVVNTTKPANGNLTVQKDGSFVYMPNANFNGQDGFEFTVTDGNGGYAKGVVVISIGEERVSSSVAAADCGGGDNNAASAVGDAAPGAAGGCG